MREAFFFVLHLRFVEVRHVEGGVGVQHVAVVEAERLPGFLVFGKVPAGGELRLQGLMEEDE